GDELAAEIQTFIAAEGLGPEDFLIQGQRADGSMSPEGLYAIVKSAAKKAGIEKFSPHWLRQAHASHSMDKGVNPRAALSDLCHHAACANGQYAESSGSLGRNAQHVLRFWQRRRPVKAPTSCPAPNCTWEQL